MLLLILFIAAWFYLIKQVPQKSAIPQKFNEAAHSLPSSKTNLAGIVSNPSATQIEPQPKNTNDSTAPIKNALNSTNLEQWTTAIKGLHKLPGLSENWDVEITNRTSGIRILLTKNGQTVSYKTQFIDIRIKDKTGDILEAQLQSPIMNIDQTRELGLQLCNMLELDSGSFLAWCNKVGNHWLDAPLYGTGEGGHHYSFQVLRTYMDEKPWCINFMIIPNP